MSRTVHYRFRADIDSEYIQIRTVSTAGALVDVYLTKSQVLTLAEAVRNDTGFIPKELPPLKKLRSAEGEP